MKIRTFPGDGYMTIETTPDELRDIATRMQNGDVIVQREIEGVPEIIVLGFKLDEDVARRLPHASKVSGQ